MSANGRLSAAELVSVDGVQLSIPTANAYRRMQAAALVAGVKIWIALPIGGYRNWFVQGDMPVHPALYGLNPDSHARIAPQGDSSHGLGDAVDIGSFPPADNLLKWGVDGQRRREWLLAHAAEFGFWREFNEVDPNHFHHDGKTAIEPIGLFMALTPDEEQEILLGMRDLHTGTGLGNARAWTQTQVEAFSLYSRLKALQSGAAPTPITLSDTDKADIASRVAAQLTGLQFVPKAS